MVGSHPYAVVAPRQKTCNDDDNNNNNEEEEEEEEEGEKNDGEWVFMGEFRKGACHIYSLLLYILYSTERHAVVLPGFRLVVWTESLFVTSILLPSQFCPGKESL